VRGEAFIFGFEDRFCQNSFLTGRPAFNKISFLKATSLEIGYGVRIYD